MSERMVMKVKFYGETIAYAYYRWGGLPSAALDLTKSILTELRISKEQELIPRIYHALASNGAVMDSDDNDHLKALGYEFEQMGPRKQSDGLISFAKEMPFGGDYELTIYLEDLTADLESLLKHWELKQNSEAFRYMNLKRDEIPTTKWKMDLAKLNEADVTELDEVCQKAIATQSLFVVKGRNELFDSPS